MSEVVRIVRALVNQEPGGGNHANSYFNTGANRDESSEYDMYEDRDSMASVVNGSGHHHHHSEMSSTRLLSSLVGGTASVLDGAKFSPTNAPTTGKSNAEDLRVIDMSKPKDELDTEFEQVIFYFYL